VPTTDLGLRTLLLLFVVVMLVVLAFSESESDESSESSSSSSSLGSVRAALGGDLKVRGTGMIRVRRARGSPVQLF
jgi:hypothetical protein